MLKPLRWAVLSLLGGLAFQASAFAQVVDEAKALGKKPEDFPAADYDYFRDMDQVPDPAGSGRLVPLNLTADEIKGRNTWMLWCGGNETFWDWLATHSYGFMDLLKLCEFGPHDKLGGKRWAPAGIVIEPGTKIPDKPDEFGLYIRQPVDPAAKQPDPKVYGRSSGIVGLRLFPNPNFAKAGGKWDPERYFNDESYFTDPKLVRPYRIGMSCAFCHASPHPLNPAADVEKQEWANLSANIGAQYLRTRAVFGNQLKPDSFIYHVLDSQPPGTTDTSLIASDNINNPNTMNAIWDVPARLDRSGIYVHRTPEFARDYQARYGHNSFEKLSGDSAKMPVLLKDAPGAMDNPRPVPHVLAEGADSVGAWGALARVYLNIGTFSEQWVTLHNPLVGFRKQEPFRIADCEQNSVYWQVNKLRVEYLAKFFLKSTAPMRLKDAVGGRTLIQGSGVPWGPEHRAGREVFATHCIICHSSKQPNGMNGAPQGPEAIAGDKLLSHLRSPAYKAWALSEVERKDFWENNYLSSEVRIPITVVKSNAGRGTASNGIEGHMWQDFSSDTYKSLPGVGNIVYWNPFTQKEVEWTVPSGGRGYLRPPSLISVWATAPYLHNNTVGLFNNDPSVRGRLEAFEDGIRRLLVTGKSEAEAAAARWSKGPARDVSAPINGATTQRYSQDHGLIWRTSAETYLNIPAKSIQGLLLGVAPGIVPGFVSWKIKNPWTLPVVPAILALILFAKAGANQKLKKWAVAAAVVTVIAAVGAFFIRGRLGDLRIGPIPAGTPVSLLASTSPTDAKMPANVLSVIHRLKAAKLAGDADRDKAMAEVADKLLEISNCPDLVMDRGHYFSTDLTPQELEALIALLKTF